jgi:hypothetical protein
MRPESDASTDFGEMLPLTVFSKTSFWSELKISACEPLIPEKRVKIVTKAILKRRILQCYP